MTQDSRRADKATEEYVLYSSHKERYCTRCETVLPPGSFFRKKPDETVCLTCLGLSDFRYLPEIAGHFHQKAWELSRKKAQGLIWDRLQGRYVPRGVFIEPGAMRRVWVRYISTYLVLFLVGAVAFGGLAYTYFSRQWEEEARLESAKELIAIGDLPDLTAQANGMAPAVGPEKIVEPDVAEEEESTEIDDEAYKEMLAAQTDQRVDELADSLRDTRRALRALKNKRRKRAKQKKRKKSSIRVSKLPVSKIVRRISRSKKPTFLHLFASWCGACRTAFARVDKVCSEYRARGVSCLIVSTDTSSSKLRKFLRANPHSQRPVRIASDSRGELSDELSRLGASYGGSIPYSAIFDRRGRLVSEWTGALSTNGYRTEFEKAR